MSFPSSVTNLASGMDAETALLSAMQTDTPDGFGYVTGLVDAWKSGVDPADAAQHVRSFIPCKGCAKSVLRAERVAAGGLKVDVEPDSKLGKQVMRLLGTDAARALLERHFGMFFSLSNCCGPLTGDEKKKTVFSVAEQIAWQASIDC